MCCMKLGKQCSWHYTVPFTISASVIWTRDLDYPGVVHVPRQIVKWLANKWHTKESPQTGSSKRRHSILTVALKETYPKLSKNVRDIGQGWFCEKELVMKAAKDDSINQAASMPCVLKTEPRQFGVWPIANALQFSWKVYGVWVL